MRSARPSRRDVPLAAATNRYRATERKGEPMTSERLPSAFCLLPSALRLLPSALRLAQVPQIFAIIRYYSILFGIIRYYAEIFSRLV
jgi:hypothetical protein